MGVIKLIGTIIRVTLLCGVVIIVLAIVLDKEKSQVPVATGYLGDTLNNGSLEVTFDQMQTAKSVGSLIFSETAAEGGIYVIVRVRIKNIGSKSISSFGMPRIKLMDGSGREYSLDVGASAAVASEWGDNSKVVSDLNPGIAITDVNAFEVSESAFDASTWKVKVDDIGFYLVSRPQPVSQQPDVPPPAEPQSQAEPEQAVTPPESSPVAAEPPVPSVPMTLSGELSTICPDHPDPHYPSGSKGRTVLGVELDEEGRVASAEVLVSSGYPRLDEAALNTVKGWRCNPMTRDGAAVRTIASQSFNFGL